MDERVHNLETMIVDSKSPLFADSLLDSVTALVLDCNLPSLRRNKNVENFLGRCKRLFLATHALLKHFSSLPQTKVPLNG
jgi:hypothetical protein